MKIRVDKDVLTEAVSWVARALPNRPPNPVLAGVLLDATGEDTVTLSAFDYETSAKVTLAAEVTEAGQTLVLGRMLNDICRSLPNKPVDLVADAHKVTVSCGSSTFSLPRMPAEEYPTLPRSPQGSGVVDGTVFTHAVQQVSVAADRGDTLPILTGVRVEVEGDTMTMLATDRYRLAMRELSWTPSGPGASYLALIPARQLSDTAKSLGAAGSVELALGGAAGGDGLAGFAAGNRTTTSRLLDGEYPKVASIFPTSVDTEAVIDTASFIEAVKRVALVTERNNPIRLTFADNQVTISAGSGDDAQAREDLECTLTGPGLEVGFNPQYLLDGLGVLGTPFTRMQFTQPSRPAVVLGQAEADAEADTSYRYVLMPVRFPT